VKPVVILRHAPTEGPGYFAVYLETHGIPWQLVAIDQGERVPDDTREYCGIAYMGGPMSVNDDLSWIRQELALIQSAVQREVPVIGHCLGGQLIAKALGASVSRNAVKEIGWGRVNLVASDVARRWFGPDLDRFDAFHWHGETFSIPAGATHVLSSPHCTNQAFALGKHFAMQCHVEMTEALIATWCKDWGREVASLAARVPSVQTPDEMMRDVAQRAQKLNAVADRIYGEWIKGLQRD
jgi:GMP synthase-like glutamine amidotransferase